MKLKVARLGEATVCSPAGRITIGNELTELQYGLLPLLEGPTRLVIDLADVVYVDSAALGEFVAARRRLVEGGGRLVIARPRGKVRDLLDLTRLDRLIPMRATLDEAVAEVTADGPAAP